MEFKVGDIVVALCSRPCHAKGRTYKIDMIEKDFETSWISVEGEFGFVPSENFILKQNLTELDKAIYGI